MLTIVTADKIVHVQFFFLFFPTLQKYDIIATGWVSCDVNSRQTFLWLYYVKMLFLSVISTSVAVGNSDLLFLPFVKFFFIILFSFLFPPSTFFRVIYNLCTPNHFTSPLRTCLFSSLLSLYPLCSSSLHTSLSSRRLCTSTPSTLWSLPPCACHLGSCFQWGTPPTPSSSVTATCRSGTWYDTQTHTHCPTIFLHLRNQKTSGNSVSNSRLFLFRTMWQTETLDAYWSNFSPPHLQVKAGFGVNLIGVAVVMLAITTWGVPLFNLTEFPAWALARNVTGSL